MTSLKKPGEFGFKVDVIFHLWIAAEFFLSLIQSGNDRVTHFYTFSLKFLYTYYLKHFLRPPAWEGEGRFLWLS